jgi:rfaE bifunctional protein nucleotidyltransferase chain/domain
MSPDMRTPSPPAGPGLEHPRVLDRAALVATLDALSNVERGRKCVVFTNGCFDILHPGHVDLLNRAKALGDILVVGVNSDASARRLAKGADRPFNTQAARAFVLAHLGSVDYVSVFDEETPYALIAALRPDVLVKGGDWGPERIVGRDLVEAAGGAVYSLPLVAGYSTTGLAARIKQASAQTA